MNHALLWFEVREMSQKGFPLGKMFGEFSKSMNDFAYFIVFCFLSEKDTLERERDSIMCRSQMFLKNFELFFTQPI